MTISYYRSSDFFASRIVDTAPDVSNFRMHTHLLVELYWFHSGSGVFHVEGTQYQLKPGDVLLMRPTEAHFIEVDPTVAYERTVVNFDVDIFQQLDPDHVLLAPLFDRKAGQKNLYRAEDLKGSEYANFIDNLSKHKGSRIASFADLVQLMFRINEVFGAMKTQQQNPDSVENKMLRHINNNLSSDLTLEHLCDRFFLSRAQLCRRFKLATGTSVGKYITAKRLISAQQLILKGFKPTEIYATCGFQDYSSFYRAYRKYFGHSPKDKLASRTSLDGNEYGHIIE